MLGTIERINIVIFVLFAICYSYQGVYLFIRFIKKMPVYKAKNFHRFAVIIAARNEETVIGELIRSIRSQNYPADLVDIYVVADNCTDDTAGIAEGCGATVFRRFNDEKVGKGYVLDFCFKRIARTEGLDAYDGYFIFDADNVLDENYITEMNNVFDSGYRVVTSYRNSKNYGSNWISAGYALWFLRESKYLNGARMICRTSCAVSGTGFLVSRDIIEKDNGWKYSLLTEDVEFSTDSIINGEVIGYAERAVFYDEQPVTFKASWNQRMRWCKGFYQVITHYGANLTRGCFLSSGKRFQCYDMLMTIAPAALLSISLVLVNIFVAFYGIMSGHPYVTHVTVMELLWSAFNLYFTLIAFGGVTLFTEWNKIYAKKSKKILYLFTFPVFMFTYLPIAIVALFKKVTWKPIRHTYAQSVAEVRR